MSSLQKPNQLSENEISLNISIPCAFHKDKIITNFCSTLPCLLPMCPVCIAIHSEQHRQENTHGQFESIQQVIQSISVLLLKTNKSLEDLSEQYTEDYWNKEKLLDSCRQALYGQKKKLIKQIERKFDEIQHKMTRKINEFQDSVHDRYKSLQSQIQYLYDSINKQRQDFISSNDKILKNVITFYSQKKEQKIKEWQNKFRFEINELKKSSIKLKCSDELFDLVKSIEYFFTVEEFKDQENEYLISTGRDLMSSNTKRRKVESPRWQDDKENNSTVRPNMNKYNTENDQSAIKGLNQAYNYNNREPWSATKF